MSNDINVIYNDEVEIKNLITNSEELIAYVRGLANKQINIIQIMTYFSLGRWIVDVQQGGEDRAQYGDKVIEILSQKLTEKYGRGFSKTNLKYFRQFYITYSDRISQTLFDQFANQKSQTMSDLFKEKAPFKNTSMKEGGRSKEARIIYDKRDEFGSRRPIDVIKANNPIIILDEPQKMGGDATQKALKNFNPLFTLNYSATHAKHHNLVYALDAVDAYNQRLVKKIEVKGFQLKNFRGTDHYLYLEDIIISPKHPPKARIEMEIKYNASSHSATMDYDV